MSEPLPMKEEFLSRLPALPKTSGECPVCYNEPTTLIVLHCSHSYCNDCLRKWLEDKTTCPSCRRELYQKKEEDNDDELEEGEIEEEDSEDEEDDTEAAETYSDDETAWNL